MGNSPGDPKMSRITGPTLQSLWSHSAKEDAPNHQALPENPIDVAIIGGGFTGLSTALHCAEADLCAHVIEAHDIGHGGSGRNVGLVNAGVWMPPAAVSRHLGTTYGPRFLRYFGDGPQMVFDLIEKHQIQCDVTRSGTIHVAHSPAGLHDLSARANDWQALGAPVSLLTAEEVAQKLGTQAYYGGLLDARAGTINPMGYCRGLARAAVAKGAQISTGVQAQKLVKEQNGWRVITDHGELRAKTVVLGTNAYTDTLWPGLKHSYSTIHFFQFATEPLGPRADMIFPERQGVWDTGQIMTSLRKDIDNRLIIGSMGRVMGTSARGISHKWAQHRLRRLFPKLGPVRFESAWHGKIAMTPDHMPRIHILEEGLFTPIGYNGRGITTGTIFGQSMATLLTGAAPETLPLPISTVKKIPARRLRNSFYDAVFAANQVFRR